MQNLANRPWMKAAEKSFSDSGIFKISDLAKLSKMKAHSFDKYLKAPDSVATIREALRKYEKSMKKREQEKPIPAATASSISSLPAAAAAAIVKVDKTVKNASKKTGIASIVEESTPEEEDKTMQEIYDRPSPSPTDDLPANKESSTVDSQSDSESLMNPVLTQRFVDSDDTPTDSVATQRNAETIFDFVSQDVEMVDSAPCDDVVSVGDVCDVDTDPHGDVISDGDADIVPQNSVGKVSDTTDVLSITKDDAATDVEIDSKKHAGQSIDMGSQDDVDMEIVSAEKQVEMDEHESDVPVVAVQESDVPEAINHDSREEKEIGEKIVEMEATGDATTETAEGDAAEEEEKAEFDKWIRIMRRSSSKSDIASFSKQVIDLLVEVD
jgi:hypothetical protein